MLELGLFKRVLEYSSLFLAVCFFPKKSAIITEIAAGLFKRNIKKKIDVELMITLFTTSRMDEISLGN